MKSELIFFYDGSCGFCAASVRFLHRIDRADRLRFAPLGGITFLANIDVRTARRVTNSQGEWQGAVALAKNEVYLGEEAVLKALSYCSWPGPFLGKASRVAPKCLRDAIYEFIAKRRFKIKRSTCQIPESRLRAKLLD